MANLEAEAGDLLDGEDGRKVSNVGRDPERTGVLERSGGVETARAVVVAGDLGSGRHLREAEGQPCSRVPVVL